MARWGPRKYQPLAAYLAGLPPETGRITLSLHQIEQILGGPLPPSARTASWWSNTARWTHARAWLAAGWHVAAPSLRSLPPTITFARGPVAPRPLFTAEP